MQGLSASLAVGANRHAVVAFSRGPRNIPGIEVAPDAFQCPCARRTITTTAAGFDAYLVKPVTPQSLAEVLARVESSRGGA